ncbi:hypothetical protein BGZ60DRAFT_561262 [Tricladium varicosporioides]|nr:hypothetical protein BGZ60DRAFT_561262 [Hymenoscyphus varicosporioides]
MAQVMQRGSVHYKPCDPYHPLRLNPAGADTQANIQVMCSPQSKQDQASGHCCDHYPEGQEGDLEANSQPCALSEEANLPVEDHDLAHCPTIQVVSSQEQLREHILDQCSKKQDPISQSIRGHDLDMCVKAEAPVSSQSHTLEQCPTTRVTASESPRGHELEECNKTSSSPEQVQSHSLHQCSEAITVTPHNVQSHEIDACPTVRVSPPDGPSEHKLEHCPTTQITSEISQGHSLEQCLTTEVPLELQGHTAKNCVLIEASSQDHSHSHGLENCFLIDAPQQPHSQSHSLDGCPSSSTAENVNQGQDGGRASF